jgi:hypothetical protein
MASNTHSNGGSTDSKGGNATSKGDQISRGAPHLGSDRHPKQRKRQDNEYTHPASTTTNCAGLSITIQVTALHIPTQLHLPGQRLQLSPHEMNHQINSQKYHAGSHAVTREHIQAKLHCIRGPGDPELCQKSQNQQGQHSQLRQSKCHNANSP